MTPRGGRERVVSRFVRAVRRTLGGIGAAVRSRPYVFGTVAIGVLGLNIFLPLFVLSITRKPFDYFTINPWIKKLPAYLISGEVAWQQKLEFLPGLALFWFSADSPYGGVEWGFAVTAADLTRFLMMSVMLGAYFALWFYHRDRPAQPAWGTRTGRHGGVLGALVSTLGLSTGPCTVTGCGAPVIPVLGLAFVGLSSGTLKFLAEFSRTATGVVLLAVTLGVVYLGWNAGGEVGDRMAPAGRESS